MPGYVFWSNATETDLFDERILTSEEIAAETANIFSISVTDVFVTEAMLAPDPRIKYIIYVKDTYKDRVDWMHNTIKAETIMVEKIVSQIENLILGRPNDNKMDI